MIYNFADEAFLNLMNEDSIQLPKRWDGKDLSEYLNNDIFNIYKKKVGELIGIVEAKIIHSTCEDIIEIIKKYYNGFPAQAYKMFEELMKVLWKNPIRKYQKTGWGESFDVNDPLRLYRIRRIKVEKPFNRKDIFHTPFQLRALVSSCRYSIAGYPSLYLSTSLYLCNLEVCGGKTKIQRIASKFLFNRDNNYNGNTNIKVLEFAVKPKDFVDDINLNPQRYRLEGNTIVEVPKINQFDELDLSDRAIRSNYLLWYPLIAACSFICTDKDNPFCSEYIIPQLLTQWLRENSGRNDLLGIRYFSCKSKLASEGGVNYMFPTSYRNHQDKYCKVLGKAFRFTNPIHMHDYKNIDECEKALVNDNDLGAVDK